MRTCYEDGTGMDGCSFQRGGGQRSARPTTTGKSAHRKQLANGRDRNKVVVMKCKEQSHFTDLASNRLLAEFFQEKGVRCVI